MTGVSLRASSLHEAPIHGNDRDLLSAVVCNAALGNMERDERPEWNVRDHEVANPSRRFLRTAL